MFVDTFDLTIKSFESTVLDFHAVASAEFDLDASRLRRRRDANSQHAINFLRLHRDRLPCRSREVSDSICRSNQIPSLIIQDHLNHQIAGIQLLFDDPALAGLVIHDLFDGDHNLPEKLVESLLADSTLQRITNGSFAIALNLQNVPFHLLLSTFRHGRLPPGPLCQTQIMNTATRIACRQLELQNVDQLQ